MSAIVDRYIAPYLKRLKKSSLFKDSFWSLVGSTIGRGLSLVAGIFVARFLGKDLYGEFGIIKTTLIYIEIFSTFGLGYTATKFIAEFKNGNRSQIGPICKATINITLATSGFMAVMVLIFAKQIAVLIDAPHLYSTLRITAAGVIVNAINIAQIGILSGLAEFKVIARNTTLAGFITFVLTIILTYFGGINGAVTALVLSYGTQCLLNNISVKAAVIQYQEPIVLRKSIYYELLKFSFPIALQESLYSIVNWVISIMLIKMCGYGELGLYSAAAQWAAIISFIPGILRNVTLSHLSSSSDNKFAHENTLKAMLLVNFISTSAMFLFVLLFLNLICSFYGNSFDGLKSVLIAQTFCAIVISVSNVYAQEFMSRGRNWAMFICRFTRDVMSLVLSFVIIRITHNSGALILSLAVLVMNIIYFVSLYFIYKIDLRNNRE